MCPHCGAAYQALLDQIVEHKVELEDLKERLGQMEAVVDTLHDEFEYFEDE